jgi:hypothetical protein
VLTAADVLHLLVDEFPGRGRRPFTLREIALRFSARALCWHIRNLLPATGAASSSLPKKKTAEAEESRFGRWSVCLGR